MIFLHEVAVSAWHFVRGRQRRLIALSVFDVTPQREFKTLQPFGDLRLQPLELPRVFVDAVVVELTHGAKHLVEIGRIHAVIPKLIAEPLGFGRPVARLVTESANLARCVNALAPAAPVIAVRRGAAE